MPTLFVPHGAPTFALQPGAAGDALAEIAARIPPAQAVLIVSAHWDTRQPAIGAACRPETVHDFHGFPAPLYSIRYPARGAVSWATEARALLEEAGFDVAMDARRGLDHGAWIPLMMMFPDASIPVVPMSVQGHLGPEHHFRLGRALAPLREAGVLIVGSGNLTHNLGHFRAALAAEHELPYVSAFQRWVGEKLSTGNAADLLDYRAQAPGAVEAHPTEEHWLPFYVALGAAGEAYTPELLYSGVEYGLLAMDSYAFWPKSKHEHARDRMPVHSV